VRQRLLVFLRRSPIAHIDIAAADRAFPEALGLAQWRLAYRAKSAEGKVRHPVFKGIREDL
jgi:hypothetical protein